MLNRCVNQEEIIDDLKFSHPILLQNLNEMELLNRKLGYNKTLIKGINKVYEKCREDFYTRNIRFTDLGCGSGDSLRLIQDWALTKKINLDLHGIDGNAYVIDYARGMSSSYPEIKYQLGNILNFEDIGGRHDIVTLNNLCHHFTDNSIIEILQHLHKNTSLAIIINDIHRHPLAYLGIKLLTRLLSFSYLGKNDAPLSVLRAFCKDDLCNILKAAKIDTFEVNWTWPFRW